MRFFVLLLATASIAEAQPLSPAWRAPGCALIQRRGADELVSVDATWSQLVRFELATGKSRPSLPLPMKVKGTYVAEVVGDTVVLKSDKAFVGIDAATGVERWRSPSALDWPRYLRADADLVVTYKPQQAQLLERLDGKAGAARWSVEVPKTAGEVHWLGGDGARLFVAFNHASKKKYVLHAFDAKDGKLLWTGTSPIKAYQTPAIAGGAIVIPDNGDGMRILDAGTGKELGNLSFPRMRNVRAAGERAFFVQAALPLGSRDEMVAIDIATRKTLWTVPMSEGDSWLEGATGAAVVVIDGQGTLRLLDPASGKVRSSYGIADKQNVDVAERAPMVVLCDGAEVIALDPAAPAAADETATVTASIKCKGCKSRKLPFRIGDATGTTDDKGNLSAAVTGRGRYSLELRLGDGGWTRTKAVVALDGKKEQALGQVAVEAQVLGD